jgi:hypothetical protein
VQELPTLQDVRGEPADYTRHYEPLQRIVTELAATDPSSAACLHGHRGSTCRLLARRSSGVAVVVGSVGQGPLIGWLVGA